MGERKSECDFFYGDKTPFLADRVSKLKKMVQILFEDLKGKENSKMDFDEIIHLIGPKLTL